MDQKAGDALPETTLARQLIRPQLPVAPWGKTSARPSARARDKRPRSSRRPTKGAAGAGPFQSILKERSVAFNLTLDVQNIRQEIQSLMMARDLLNARIVRHRREPTGSLLLKIKAYFEVFRRGWAISDGRRKFPRSAADQLAFLSNIVHEHVWIGNNLYGVRNLAHQMEIYSTFMRIIEIRMFAHHIVDVEDSVVINTSGVLRFQVIRSTIMEIFPHVLGHESLVNRLIGQEISAPINTTFYFDAQGTITRYEVELDLVGAFRAILKNPGELAALLGQALIYENSMFGLHLLDEPAVTNPPDNVGQDLQRGADGTCT